MLILHKIWTRTQHISNNPKHTGFHMVSIGSPKCKCIVVVGTTRELGVSCGTYSRDVRPRARGEQLACPPSDFTIEKLKNVS